MLPNFILLYLSTLIAQILCTQLYHLLILNRLIGLELVILANSPVSDAVIQVLNGMSLPKGIRNQINEAQTGVSEREILEQNINGFLGEIQLLINDLQRRFNQRNEKPREKQLLIEQNDLESQKKLSQILLADGDVTGSQTLINAMVQDPIVSSVNENVQFCDLMNCLITMTTQNRTINDLTVSETQIVEDVAHSTTKIANTAQVILSEATGEITNYPIVKIPSGNNLRIVTELEEQIDNNGSKLVMYPNPTAGLISIEYDGVLEGQLSVKVYNILGKMVFSLSVTTNTINLSQLDNGVYFINFINADGNQVDAQRLIIQK